MRILVTGTEGQVARAMAERAEAHGVTVTLLGRPDLDLAEPARVVGAVCALAADIVVNAAAYTAVDQAEAEPALAQTVNEAGAHAVASAAAKMGIPIVQLSTDYVFDGSGAHPYREDDPVEPLGVYGRTKLAGERAVAEANPDHAILRTAWVYSPFGKNFVRTMLRVGQGRDEVAVVADQHGSPTSALDIADGVITVCRNLLAQPKDLSLRGVFHMTGQGYTTWADFAEAIFDRAGRQGGPSPYVRRIATAEYLTPARRPASSRLDCSRLARVHGVALPAWRQSVEACVDRLLTHA